MEKILCENCGGELTEKSKNGYCTRCGYLNKVDTVSQEEVKNDEEKVLEVLKENFENIEKEYSDEQDYAPNWWYIFGFVFFPVAIISYLYFKKFKPLSAKKMLTGAFIGLICYSVFFTFSYRFMRIYYDYNYELGAIAGKIEDMTLAVKNDYTKNNYTFDKKYTLSEIQTLVPFDIKSVPYDVYFDESSYIYVTYKEDFPVYTLCFIDTEQRGLNKYRYNGVYPESIKSNLNKNICKE